MPVIEYSSDQASTQRTHKKRRKIIAVLLVLLLLLGLTFTSVSRFFWNPSTDTSTDPRSDAAVSVIETENDASRSAQLKRIVSLENSLEALGNVVSDIQENVTSLQNNTNNSVTSPDSDVPPETISHDLYNAYENLQYYNHINTTASTSLLTRSQITSEFLLKTTTLIEISDVNGDGLVSGKILKWNGTEWVVSDDKDTNTTYSASNGLTLSDTTFKLGGSLSANTSIDLESYSFAFTDGNVGIGSTAPGYTLDVNGMINAGSGFRTTDDYYIGSIGLNDTTSATTSGAYFIGVYDQFINSNSGTVQGVLADLDTAFSSSSHAAVTLAGSLDYLTLSTQQITLNAIDLTTDVTGLLPLANGGTNADLSGVSTGGIIYKGATALAGSGALTGVLKGNGSSAPTAMTGIANYVTRWSDANTLGTGVLYDDGTNVGINTTVPGVRFDVVGGSIRADGDLTGGDIYLGYDDVTATITTSDTDESLTLDPNGTGSIFLHGATYYIDSNGLIYLSGLATTGYTATAGELRADVFRDGNSSYYIQPADTSISGLFAGSVGIGTTSPGSLVDVAGYIKAPGATLSATYAGGTALTLNAGPSATADILSWQTSTGSVLGVIDESGNIGIGSINPAQKLDVVGDVRISGLTASLPVKTNANKDLISGAINLASAEVTGILGLSNGGTNADLSGVSNGGIIYKGPSALAGSGSLTGVLRGNGSSAPDAMTGTQNYVTRWTDANSLGTGVLYDNGTNVGISTTNPASFKLEVAGNIGPTANNTYDLGSNAARWANVYATNFYQAGNAVCDISGNCAAVGNIWQYANGAISPSTPYTNNSDLLIGSNASASAKFAILNVFPGTAGSPTASVSSGLSGTSMFMTADGTLSTTRRSNLTIGNSATYDTTGNVLINPNGTGNVGIGSVTPGYKLDIVSTVASDGLRITNSAVGGPFIVLNASNATPANRYAGVVLQSGGTDQWATELRGGDGNLYIYDIVNAQARMTVTPAGNVGIGSVTPGSKLDVNGGTGASAITGLKVASTDVVGGAFPVMINTDTTGMTFGTSAGNTLGRMIRLDDARAAAGFYDMGIDTSGYFFITQKDSTTAALTVNNTGNVGIGSTAPTAKLDVDGNIALTGSNPSTISSESIMRLDIDSNNNSTADYLDFTHDVGTSLMRILESGNVGIGTTTPTSTIGWQNIVDLYDSVNAGYRMHAAATAQESGIGTDGVGLYVDVAGHATATNNDIYFRTEETNSSFTPTARMTIASDGNVGIGTTGPTDKLDIHHGANGAGISINNSLTAVNSSSRLSFDFGTIGTTAYIETLKPLAGTTGTNIKNDMSFNLYDGASWNLPLYLQSSGNVGIGTTTPSALLHAYRDTTGGDPSLSSDAGNVFKISTTTTPELAFGGYAGTPYGMWMQVKRNSNDGNTYPLIIQPLGGNVGIGSVTPGTKLDVTGDIRTNDQLISTVATGTAPLAVTSTTVVANLNADMVDGHHADTAYNSFGNATVPVRHASGYIFSNYFNMTADDTAVAATMIPVETGNDGYLRWQTPANFRTSLGLGSGGAGDIWVDEAGDTMTGGLNFSAVTSDITTGTNEHLALMPNGTGNVGIGTTAPGYTLQVGSSVSTASEYINVTSAANQQTAISFSSAATQQSVIYRPASSDDLRFYMTTGGDAMSIIQGGNVGIGTTTNTVAKLRVIGGSGRNYFGGTTNGVVLGEVGTRAEIGGHNNAHSAWADLYMQVGGGNVGIGSTTAPASQLSVVKRDNTGGAIASFYPLNLTQGTRITYRGLETISGDMFIDAFTNSDIVMNTQGTGNVGIGIAAPTSELHVGGTTPELRIGDDGAEDSSLAFMGNAADYHIGLDDTDDLLKFGLGTALGTTTYMSINTFGEMSLDQAGAKNAASTGLQIDNVTTNTTADNASKYGIYINSTGTATGGAGTANRNYGIYVNAVSGSDTNYAAYFNGSVGIMAVSPTQALDVTGRIALSNWAADGDTVAYRDTTTNSIALVTSDRRLKKNIVPLTGALDIVNQLNTYKYNDLDEADGAKLRLGFMGQEVLPLMPELTYQFYKEGSSETYYGVHYDKMPVLLLQAMKELSATVDEQGNKGITFNSEGELIINGSNGTYTVTASGNTLTTIIGSSKAVIAKITAGLINTRELVVTQSATIADLTVTNLTVSGQSINDYIRSIVQTELQNQPTPLPPDAIAQNFNSGMVINNYNTTVTIVQDQNATSSTTFSATGSGEIANYFNVTEVTEVRLDERFNILATLISWSDAAVDGVRTLFINAPTTFKYLAWFQGPVKVNADTSGILMIPANTLKARVSFSKPFPEVPTIYVNFSETAPVSYTITDTNQSGFTINFAVAPDKDLNLQWLALLRGEALNGPSLEVMETGSGAPAILPTPTPIPINTPSPVVPTPPPATDSGSIPPPETSLSDLVNSGTATDSAFPSETASPSAQPQ